MGEKVIKSEAEWREQLSAEEFRVLRQKGTERAFTGEYWNTKAQGTYRCAGCGAELYASEDKYDSGCGWPSFTQPLSRDALRTETDLSHGMVRIEVMCNACGGHLGHVFPDGPKPLGTRHCINSVSIVLEPDASESAD